MTYEHVVSEVKQAWKPDLTLDLSRGGELYVYNIDEAAQLGWCGFAFRLDQWNEYIHPQKRIALDAYSSKATRSAGLAKEAIT